MNDPIMREGLYCNVVYATIASTKCFELKAKYKSTMCYSGCAAYDYEKTNVYSEEIGTATPQYRYQKSKGCSICGATIFNTHTRCRVCEKDSRLKKRPEKYQCPICTGYKEHKSEVCSDCKKKIRKENGQGKAT